MKSDWAARSTVEMRICTISPRLLVFIVVFLNGLATWSTSFANADAAGPSYTVQKFDFRPFAADDLNKLVLSGNASVENKVIELLPTSDSWNKSGPTLGKVLYKEPIRLRDPSDRSVVASWSTTFVFKMTPANGTLGADGMVFMMVADPNVTGDPGGDFGIFKNNSGATTTFAIEFDTWANRPSAFPDAQNNNHVGVDINSTTSEANRTASDIDIVLNSAEKIRAWIDYDHPSTRLEVRMAYYDRSDPNKNDPNNSRPPDPFISHVVDMSGIVTDEVWIGFSASTGTNYQYYQYHNLYSWSFSSKLSNNTVAQSISVPGSKRWSRAKKASVAAAVCTGGLFLLLFLFLLGLKLYNRRGAKVKETPEKLIYHIESARSETYPVNPCKLLDIVVDSPRSFSYKQLRDATEDFSEKCKLGCGGFGCVYRGVISSTSRPDTPPRKIAVKRLSHDSKQGPSEFLSEIKIITCLRHRNLVQLLGWCQDEKRNELLLVYEFLPHGSLDKHLFYPNGKNPVLPWSQRFSILRGIAAALEYLHEGSLAQVIHRDVKCSNVMLDENYNAKLGDFGLARVVDHAPYTTRPAGSFGYIAPETFQTGKATLKSDVYSFGAILLEVACGRRALDMTLWDISDDGFIVDFVWSLIADKEDPDRILDAADKMLEGSFDVNQMKTVLQLGLVCSNPDPDSRPCMRQVVQILAGEASLPPVPSNKPVPVYIPTDLEGPFTV